MKILPTAIVSLALFSVVAATSAHAGSLAPAPRVVAKYERAFLERSGSQTLEELLDTGILRYFLTGGQSLLVLVDGRPYATTEGDLDSLPISAIERIELLSGESLGTLGGSAVRGALNVVLRDDLDGFETRSLARMPSREGGDGWQGSVFWGGEAGKGRMTIGADYFKRQEIASRSRDYSRSAWREGGAFNEAQNVSVGGNTVWVVQRDDKGEVTGVRSVALGDCDPAKGYTGPLGNPPGIRNGDKGCGFAYGAIMWETARYDQKSAVVNLDHPLGEDAELHLDARVVQSDWAFRYAPSVGSFSLAPNASLLQAINAAATAAGSDFQADGNDRVSVAHRFVGFGNRGLADRRRGIRSLRRRRGPADELARLRCAPQRVAGGEFPDRRHVRACRQDSGGSRGGKLRPREPVLDRARSFAGYPERESAGGDRFQLGTPRRPAGAGGLRVRDRRPRRGMDRRGRGRHRGRASAHGLPRP